MPDGTAGELPTWDLRDLYPAPDAPELERDLARAMADAQAFEARHAGKLAGMGGAYVSLIRVPQWTDGITAGAGWIALAIVVFASWKPWRVLLGAYLFGGITVLQLNLQAAGATIPVEYLSMSPYLITILVLVIMSSGKGRAAKGAPASLGQNFHASR